MMPASYYDQNGKLIKKEKIVVKTPKKNPEGEAKEKEKGKEEAPRGFFNRFNNKIVIIKLISGDTLEGRLVTDGYNKYDCLLETPGKSEVLITKHSIVSISIDVPTKKKDRG